MPLPAQPPASLKPVSHYLKVATEHDTRDPVISYWARFAAVQKALTIDKSSPDAKMFVISLLEWLEGEKKRLANNESVTIEAAGEAHVENYALKLFTWADKEDRSGVFNKNVVKAFYTAGILFDVLESLRPPLSDEFQSARKYAKWKAAYIHNCLKNGETPIPGDNTEDNEADEEENSNAPGASSSAYGFVAPPQQPQVPQDTWNVPSNPVNYYEPEVPQQPYIAPAPAVTPSAVYDPVPSPANTSLSVEQIAKAQKYCKWAGSALNFDDVTSAIDNLEKALRLLRTGQDS